MAKKPTSREIFIEKHKDLTDKELMVELLWKQHHTMNLLNRNRINTSTIVWIAVIGICLSLFFGFKLF